MASLLIGLLLLLLGLFKAQGETVDGVLVMEDGALAVGELFAEGVEFEGVTVLQVVLG